VNEPFAVLRYEQAVLWIRDGLGAVQVGAVSGLAQLERNSPFTQWLSKVFRHLEREGSEEVRVITPASLPAELARQGAEWQFRHALHGLLRSPQGQVLGGWWSARPEPFVQHERELASWLVEAVAFALWAWERPRRSWLPRKRVWLLLAAAALLGALPVRLSVLGHAQITALQSTPITAPADAVVERILVQPNQPVQAGELLARLDDTTFRNRLAVANKSRDIALADFRRSAGKAFSEDTSKGDLQVLAARVREREAEIAYLREMLQRYKIRAPKSGIAIFEDAEQWLGRPVQTGERIMTLADPAHVGVTIHIAPDDAVQLDIGAHMVMYLNTAPLSPYSGRIVQTSYEVAMTPEGLPAYLLKATLDPGREAPRIGLKGTAKVYADEVPLAYYLLRKPLRYARSALGV
jgi:hypothetical protein